MQASQPMKGSSNSWHPAMTADTTTASYWLNWRVLLCSIWIIISMALASFLITKYEGPRGRNRGGTEREPVVGLLYEDEVWKPCLAGVHPAWLLGFRVVAFFVLLILLILYAVVDGGEIFYFYTQWTFTLITVYFGLGSLLSMYGCYRYHNEVADDRSKELDSELGTFVASTQDGSSNIHGYAKTSGANMDKHHRKVAGFWGYIFQIIFQMNAGAVVLTDCIFWFIIVPFLTIKDYNLNFLIVNMHSINAVFLLGDAALNSLRFPWFRIAYFFLWTSVYVVFQWIVHACIPLWWPYPFLDLSSSFSPLWYLAVALMHIPCYSVFALLVKLKHFLLSRSFPGSYQSEQ